MSCPRCQSNRYPNWTFWGALLLAAVCVGVIVRTDKEHRAVRTVRAEADSMLANWVLKRCVPR